MKKTFFLLAGHKVQSPPPAGQTNPFFDPPVEKNSVQLGKKSLFCEFVV